MLDVDLARHSRALNSGDYAGAMAVTVDIGARQPALHAQLRLRVLDALYSGANRDSAVSAANALSRMTTWELERRPPTAPFARPTPVWWGMATV